MDVEGAHVLHFCVGHLECMCGVVVDGAKYRCVSTFAMSKSSETRVT